MGLYKSGMTDTTKVQGWLDIFGDWDPTLAFVLGGAIIPMTITWQLTKKIKKPALASLFPKKPEQKISKSLIIGSIMFGGGWGLSGLCPGPAIASLSFGGWQGLLFFFTMALGMIMTPNIENWFSKK
jgi:uncharacterized membrane protein YedE/YeeE